MADEKISQMPDASLPLDGTELVPLVQLGANVQTPVSNLPGGGGITELTGDVTTGAGGGSQAATLSDTGVAAGLYPNANIQIGADGRISSAAKSAFQGFEATVGAGSFVFWLTGTVFNNPVSGSYVATLWKVIYDGTVGTCVVEQNGGPLAPGAPNNLEWSQTVAGAGDTVRYLMYPIEDGSVYNNQTATLSFYAYAGSGAPTITAEVVQFFGTGGAPSAPVVVASQNFVLSGAVTQYVITMNVPSTAGKTFGSNFDDSLQIRLHVPINATFDIVFSEVKLENTPAVTPFSPIPYAIMAANIERYLQFTIIDIGFTAAAAGQFTYSTIPYKTAMRKAPAITWFTVAGGSVGNLDAGLAGRPGLQFLQNYGGGCYIESAAAGACFAIGQAAMLDARL